MADVKISALPAATTPLAGTEVLPIVQSATTKQVSIANVTAGRAISASSLTLTTPLGVASGGTGLTSLTAGYIPYGNGTGAFSSSANLTFDGSSLNVSGTSNTSFRQLVVRNLSNGSGAYSVFNIGNDAFLAAMDIAVLSSSNTNFGGASSGLIQSNIGNLRIATSAAYSLQFATNGSERMRIASDGSVGIGTSSPSNKLVVSNAGAEGLEFAVAADGANINTFISYNRSTSAFNKLNVRFNGLSLFNGATEALTLDSSGNFGIGTTGTASFKLRVYGGNDNTLSIDNDGSRYTTLVYANNGTLKGNNYWDNTLNTLFFTTTVASSQMVFYTVNTERFRLDANGSVIVGTAALATSATDGFLYIPTCAGTPTGTPTTYTGRAPIVVNTTNNKLYFYSGGAWRDAGP